MTDTTNSTNKTASNWPITRILLLLLTGAFFTLMLDIREEHVDVVKHHLIGWLPISYCAFMTVACTLVILTWKPAGRMVLFWFFAAGIVIGLLGFGLHNHWNFVYVIHHAIAVWYDFKLKHGDHPPAFAPLSFAGLGLIGMLTCARKFNHAE